MKINTPSWYHGRGAAGDIVLYLAVVWLVSLLPWVGSWMVEYFSFTPLPYGIIKPWGFVTYIFLHEGFFHLLSNVIWLYMIGSILQDLVGDKAIKRLFYWGGFFGAIFYQLYFAFANHVHPIPLIGASGGVSAVVIGTAIFAPTYRLFLFGLIEVELRWIAVAKVLLDISGAMGSYNVGGYFCHLGGIAFSIFYVYGYMKGNLPGWLEEMIIAFKGLFGKSYHPSMKSSGNRSSKGFSFGRWSYGSKKTVKFSKFAINGDGEIQKQKKFNTGGNAASMNVESKHRPGKNIKPSFADEQEMNRILDKIAQVGYQNLTESEREFLFKASQE